MCRPQDVAEAVRDQDIVVHLAFVIPRLSATGRESEQCPDWARAVNVGGTRYLLNAMEACRTHPKLIFTSSVAVYGQTQDQPPPRTADDPLEPVEHYSRHKVTCEQMIRASRLQWVILRLGATLPLRLIMNPGMFDVPLDDRIEFVHRRDVALAIANAVTSEQVWGQTLLIGGGRDCCFYYGELVKRILDAMGVGMLPEQAFASTPFHTDWLDTTESEHLLRFQQRNLDDYVEDLTALLGYKRQLIRLFRPFVRHWLLSKSPHL
jgi:nucleoside-diphosphate-sugar epimerase